MYETANAQNHGHNLNGSHLKKFPILEMKRLVTLKKCITLEKNMSQLQKWVMLKSHFQTPVTMEKIITHAQ